MMDDTLDRLMSTELGRLLFVMLFEMLGREADALGLSEPEWDYLTGALNGDFGLSYHSGHPMFRTGKTLSFSVAETERFGGVSVPDMNPAEVRLRIRSLDRLGALAVLIRVECRVAMMGHEETDEGRAATTE